MSVHEVLVVGGGSTGAACAYHLAQAGVSNVLCLDMGVPGRGLDAAYAVKDPSVRCCISSRNQFKTELVSCATHDSSLNNKMYHEIYTCDSRHHQAVGKGEEKTYTPFNSGTNVFEGGSKGPNAIKMSVTLPPYHVLADFADHHGWDGVKVIALHNDADIHE